MSGDLPAKTEPGDRPMVAATPRRAEEIPARLREQDRRLLTRYPVVGAVGLALLAILMRKSFAGHLDDYLKVAGVFLTLLVGIMTAHFTRLNAWLQADAAEALETAKRENSEGLARLQRDFSVEVAKATKDYEARLAERTEEIKEYVRTRGAAYERVNQASGEYYRALETLNGGAWDEKRADEAYKEMEACHVLVETMMPDDYQEAWYRLMQIGKEMIALTKAEGRLEDYRIWQKHGKDLRGEFNALLAAAGQRRVVLSAQGADRPAQS